MRSSLETQHTEKSFSHQISRYGYDQRVASETQHDNSRYPLLLSVNRSAIG